MEALFDRLPENQVTVSANGSACVTSFQAANIKTGQRLWTNSGCASMGYELPAAIGACKSIRNAKTVCLAGDGSIMMNLQELQTIVTNNLPIKIFLLNNSGYVSIFQTQRNFFKGDEVGAGPKSGVGFPKFERLCAAFDLPYIACDAHEKMNRCIDETMQINGPAFCEIFVDENVPFAPKLSSKQLPNGTIVSPPLEDLAPFLSKEELGQSMLIEYDDKP
jgi:acetolactate synthase-1/2/3 large subunit